MEVEQQTGWSFERVSWVSLALAFIVPIAGLVYGSATGVPLSQLGGVMIGFWAFALASVFAAFLDSRNRFRQVNRRLLLVGAVMVALPGAKIIALLVRPTMVTVRVEPVVVHPPTSIQCRPELVSSDSGPVSYSKTGASGQTAWVFGIGTYYQWALSGSIAADSSSVSSTASAVGISSAWYSFNPHERSAKASARGSIDCQAVGTECVCFPVERQRQVERCGFHRNGSCPADGFAWWGGA
jgi:hypothetical protein